ncbi:phage late control D family protein [Vibrio sp. S4M6]|uniref:phage late control D family protein n=1 Tax=Vibrio sinus TaxID=2946865 RepID=UPI00202A6CF0|nr:phage late control D family protein [Vibrio sinus]MCL9783676.1 phage late control D family protein [Vibrio sinus]
MSFERQDAPGNKSDTLKLVICTADIDGVPKADAEIRWFEGYKGKEVDKGLFTITRVIPQLFPPQVTVIATAVPFKISDPTGIKERRSNSWENVSLGSIFRELVTPHGFSPRVDPELEGIEIDHISQTDETDTAFLRRLARKYDAVSKPVDGLYVLARRGKVKTITGQNIPVKTISVPNINTPSEIGFVNAATDNPSKTRFKGVIARWKNVNNGAEEEVRKGSKPFKKLSDVFASQSEANSAAESSLRENDRKGRTLRIDMEGDPFVVAEGLIQLDSTWPEHSQGSYSCDKVISRWSYSSTYRLHVTATIPL